MYRALRFNGWEVVATGHLLFKKMIIKKKYNDGGCKKSVMQLAAAIIILVWLCSCIWGCSDNNESHHIQSMSESKKKADSINADLNSIKLKLAASDSVIRILLIQYYKAGYIAGSNECIELYNVGQLSNRNMEKLKTIADKRIETLVNSK